MTASPPPAPAPATAVPPPLCFFDLESDGLNEHQHTILEVGVLLVDWDLNEISRWSCTAHFDGKVDDFIAKMHGAVELGGSGLLAICRDEVRTLHDVQREMRVWLGLHGCPLDAEAEDKPIMVGRNAHFDRRFLHRHLPRLEAMFSHRNLDASTLRMALKEWAGISIDKDAADGAHRALADISADLGVLRAARDFMRRGAAAIARVEALEAQLAELQKATAAGKA